MKAEWRVAAGAVLTLLLVTTVVSRASGSREPLERDLTTYGYVAHEMLEGRLLYGDVWDHKPPTIYLSFMLAEALWGYRQQSITLLSIIVAATSLLLLFDALRRTAGLRAAMIGGALWMLASNSVTLQANQPNVEVFLNACTIGAIWAFVRHFEGGRGWLLAAGAALALATTYKTIAAFAVVLLAGYAALGAPRGRNWASRCGAALAVMLPTVITWLAAAAVFLALGSFPAFWDAVFVFNHDYAGSVPANLWRFLTPAAFAHHEALGDVAVLVPCSLAWFVLGRARCSTLPTCFLAVLAAAMVLEVAAPGRLYPHYYQLFLPLLCLLSALLLDDVVSRGLSSKRPLAHWAAPGCVAVVLLVLAVPQARYALLRPDDISRIKYGETFVEAHAIAEIVGGLTQPGDSVFEWGGESGIYYYSQRRSAAAMVSIGPLSVGPPQRRDRRFERLVADVLAGSPAVFVFNERHTGEEQGFFQPYLRDCYELVTISGHYRILRQITPAPPTCVEVFPRHRFKPDEPLSLAASASSACRVLAGRVVTRDVAMPTERCVFAGPMLRVGSGARLHLTAADAVVLRNGFSVARGGSVLIRQSKAPSLEQ